MGHEPRGGPAGSFAQSLSQMALKALTEAAVIPKLHWEGFASRITRVATCRIQFFMDCGIEDFSSFVVVGWKSASTPCHLGLSKPPLTVWQLSSSEWASEESQREHASKMEVRDLRCDIPSLLMLSVMNKWLAQCTFEGRNYTIARIAGGGHHRRACLPHRETLGPTLEINQVKTGANLRICHHGVNEKRVAIHSMEGNNE